MYSSLEIKNETFTDFYMLFCGMQECTPSYSFGPAVREHYVLHYCVKGKGYYYVRNQKYTLHSGDAFLILPNELTFYQADEEDPWTYIWIGFDGMKADIYLKHCGLDRDHLILHCEQCDTLKSYMEDIIAHNTLSYSNELYIQGMLYLFFSTLSKSANLPYESDISSDNLHVNKAIEYIHKNYQNAISVTDIANYVSLNRSYLSTIFQQSLHMSPQQFLLKFRMTKASNLLIETNLPINQIAYSCGYSNQLAFSKAFHKVYKISPSAYRKQNQLKNQYTRDYDPHEHESFRNIK